MVPPQPKETKTSVPIFVPESLPFGGVNTETLVIGDAEMELAAQNVSEELANMPEHPEPPELPKAPLAPKL